MSEQQSPADPSPASSTAVADRPATGASRWTPTSTSCRCTWSRAARRVREDATASAGVRTHSVVVRPHRAPDCIRGRRSCRLPAPPECRSRRTSTPSRPATGGAGTLESEVLLRVEVDARRRPSIVYRSKRRAATSPPGQSHAALSGERHRRVRDLPLTTFDDGGWYWFDVVATARRCHAARAPSWSRAANPSARAGQHRRSASPPSTGPRTASTHLRDACVGPDGARRSWTRLIVADQGTEKVEDDPASRRPRRRSDDQLAVIRPAATSAAPAASPVVMYEALKNSEQQVRHPARRRHPASSRRRSCAPWRFADFAEAPTIVGGQMLNLHEALARCTSSARGSTQYRFLWTGRQHR